MKSILTATISNGLFSVKNDKTLIHVQQKFWVDFERRLRVLQIYQHVVFVPFRNTLKIYCNSIQSTDYIYFSYTQSYTHRSLTFEN